ncbi:MAG TPA: Crp/Fnr family transcriptional regulator [Pyrinomonadaceae bacterium]
MPESNFSATENRLLALLPDEERERLSPSLEQVELRQGDVIFHMDEPIERVCFPDSGIVSIVSTSARGESVEIGMVGYEGVAGLSVILGDGVPHNRRAVVQIEGGGRVIKADALRREFKRGGPFQDTLLRYAQAYLTVVSQSVFCQAFHNIDERLARWLVECQFRTKANELGLTHEYIAEIIGVRRAGVTEAVGRLTERGLITHTRGALTVVDRQGLEAAACECLSIIRLEFDRLLGT